VGDHKDKSLSSAKVREVGGSVWSKFVDLRSGAATGKRSQKTLVIGALGVAGGEIKIAQIDQKEERLERGKLEYCRPDAGGGPFTPGDALQREAGGGGSKPLLRIFFKNGETDLITRSLGPPDVLEPPPFPGRGKKGQLDKASPLVER